MISMPVDVTLSVPMIEAVLNADEAGGRITAPEIVIRALRRRRLADSATAPAYLTDAGRQVARQAAVRAARRTFTVFQEGGSR